MSKKNTEKKELTYNQKVIIAVVASLVAIGIIAAGIFLGLNKNKEKPQETVFATTGEVYVLDQQNITFSYICPYMSEKTQFFVENDKGFYITYTDAKSGKESKITTTITETPKYEASKTDSLKYGKVTLTIKLDRKLTPGETLYNAILSENTLSIKKEDYINPEITSHFNLTKTEEGLLEVNVEKYPNAKCVVPSNVEPVLSKENKKAYFTVTANIDGITKYNEEAMQNFDSFIAFKYKTEDGTFVRFLNTDVNFSVENGKVFIRGTANEEDLIPGKDYTFIMKKGFFTNDDGSVINDDYTATFTYVEA